MDDSLKKNGSSDDAAASTPAPSNFIRDIIDEDTRTGKWGGRVVTRFPPEPNGYLHIGHAKSICLNFGVARDYPGGICHLRFDDTNPEKEDMEYVEAIQRDIRWLGFHWGDKLFFASDYYGRLYQCALELIRRGKAYVCDLDADEIRKTRGTLTQPGTNSPYRARSVEENLDLFQRMKAGEFPDGSRVLRAKIDMAHSYIVMRDPVLYRIRRQSHYRTGDQWCIYPMYDFTHCLSDSFEGITHSLCTVEFENNRPLYDWVLDALDLYHPRQIEFAPLNLNFTILSKRFLKSLVEDGIVDGWDDPRMPTLSGFRRRGCPPEAIRDFCDKIGLAKRDSLVDVAMLESSLRACLNLTAPRVMAVLRPLRVVIENYPEGQVEELEAPYYPDDPPKMGYRKVPFSRVLYVERSDFMEEPHRKFWRLAPGREVRLRWAYFLRCKSVIKDPDTGEVMELRCTYDPDTRGGQAPDGRKVRGTIHWVSADHSLSAEVRLYDRLYSAPNPVAHKNREVTEILNPDSLEILNTARVEQSLADAKSGARYQFERTGYFCVDSRHSAPGKLVFNRTVGLRDSWAKIFKQGARGKRKGKGRTGKGEGRGRGRGRSQGQS